MELRGPFELGQPGIVRQTPRLLEVLVRRGELVLHRLGDAAIDERPYALLHGVLRQQAEVLIEHDDSLEVPAHKPQLSRVAHERHEVAPRVARLTRRLDGQRVFER